MLFVFNIDRFPVIYFAQVIFLAQKNEDRHNYIVLTVTFILLVKQRKGRGNFKSWNKSLNFSLYSRMNLKNENK